VHLICKEPGLVVLLETAFILTIHPSLLRIKDQAGQSLKTAISHSFVRDRRDNATLPTRGHFLSMHHELAGVGSKSDTSYFKNEIAAQIHHRLWYPVTAESGQSVAPLVLSGGLRAGLIASLDDKKPHISDRFILGGPTSVRGFKLGGIGPRDGGRISEYDYMGQVGCCSF
jgi:outer membrane protein insertion porin family